MDGKITDPLIEILAIKLYEHDPNDGYWPPRDKSMTPWMRLCEEDRESYRDLARGVHPLPDGEKP